jgi:hypothetical protein
VSWTRFLGVIGGFYASWRTPEKTPEKVALEPSFFGRFSVGFRLFWGVLSWIFMILILILFFVLILIFFFFFFEMHPCEPFFFFFFFSLPLRFFRNEKKIASGGKKTPLEKGAFLSYKNAFSREILLIKMVYLDVFIP